MQKKISISGGLEIKSINDPSFNNYGRKITEYDLSQLLEAMNKTSVPDTGNIYVAGDPQLESLPIKSVIEQSIFGGAEIQVGYCNGNNAKLNALEYHKCSEFNVAVTDLLLLLGHIRDIRDNKYDSSCLEAFYLESGTACELYGTTLHFAPCKVSEQGFKSVIILPFGVNTTLANLIKTEKGEKGLLFMKQKWLIAHPDSIQAKEKGAYPGITGKNCEINIC